MFYLANVVLREVDVHLFEPNVFERNFNPRDNLGLKFLRPVKSSMHESSLKQIKDIFLDELSKNVFQRMTLKK